LITVVCEAPGMTMEEVESLVTSPLESSMNGIARVQWQGSVSRPGQAIIWIQFDHGVDIYEARQLVAQRLEFVDLPSHVETSLAPPSCDEIFLIALRRETESGTKPHDDLARELRDWADYAARPELLTIPDVSQVTVTGGWRSEYQVVASPEHLKAYGITLRELSRAVAAANTASNVIDVADGPEVILRSLDASRPLEDISSIVVGTRSGRPVLVKDVATVWLGVAAELPDNTAAPAQPPSVATEAAVILAIRLEPSADKSIASARIEEALQQLRADLPRGAIIERNIDQRLDRLVRQTLQRLGRDMPPNMQLARHSSDQRGDSAVISPGDRIEVRVSGPDLAVLCGKADEIRRRMAEVAGVVDLRVEPQADEPRLECEIDRLRAEQLGLTADVVRDEVVMATGGQAVAQVRVGDRSYDLVVKVGRSGVDIRSIGDTPVGIPSGQFVPLSLLVTLQATSGPGAIYRENMQRVSLISCRVEDRVRSDVEPDIRKALDSILSDLEDGYRIEYGRR
jgi:Cu/Ag efflux pump CusA